MLFRSGFAVAIKTGNAQARDFHHAGVQRARGVVAALSSDADNLFLVLSAKALNPLISVSARVNEEEAEQKFRRVGADVVFRPYRMTGYRLAQSLLRPHVTEFLDFTTLNLGLDVSIEQANVSPGTDLAGKTAVISGSGNVATHAAEKALSRGAKPVTLSDSGGFVPPDTPIACLPLKITWLTVLCRSPLPCTSNPYQM